MSVSPLSRLTLLLSLALLVSACGGGGTIATPAAPTAALTITTQTLPGGNVGKAISCPPLTVENAQGPVTWDVASGALPSGLVFGSSGTITGTPTSSGLYSFVVRARDGAAEDTQPLSISIDLLELSLDTGLVHGDAWTGKPLTLSTAGASGTVEFSIVAGESGGSLSNVNGAAGTATFTPGVTGGPSIEDTIRATDLATGSFDELTFSVMVDPTENHSASFGSTDVWWIDADLKFGGHAFATDLHKALADIGLRSLTSTGATGTEADEVAYLWFRVEILRQVNALFLRNPDGSPGAEGLAISFPFEEPGAGYTKPLAGTVMNGSPTRFSQMGITTGSLNGVIGTAFLDFENNRRHENDTNDEDSELGVFPNQITPIFNATYGRPLAGTPVDADDLEALRALLYGLPSPGGRYGQIRHVGQGYARTLAAVIAHEVGHSLGLEHTVPAEGDSIMNPSASIGPSNSYAFTSEDLTRLRNALPGAGKGTGGVSALKAGFGTDSRGVQVCRCTATAGGR